MTEVTLTVEQRFLLANLVEHEIMSLSEHLGGDADALDAQLARGQFLSRVLRGAEDGVLEADPATFSMIREHREDTAATLAYDRRGLNDLRAGDMDFCFIGLSPDESERMHEAELDRGLDELGAFDALLRVGWPEPRTI